MHTYNTHNKHYTHNIIKTMQIQNNTTQYNKHNTGYTCGKHNTIDEKHNTTKTMQGLFTQQNTLATVQTQYMTYIAHCTGNSAV